MGEGTATLTAGKSGLGGVRAADARQGRVWVSLRDRTGASLSATAG